MSLTKKEREDINIIKERWENYKRMFCKPCMEMYIHCGCRNLDMACGNSDDSETNSDDSTEHPCREDGDIIAHSAHDIWTLLRIIDKL